jgi:uncharacterized protein (TIGR03118 family)
MRRRSFFVAAPKLLHLPESLITASTLVGVHHTVEDSMMQTIVRNLKTRRVAGVYWCALLLAACGGYGGGSGYNPVAAAPPPSVSLSVAPTSIVLGQSATLTWASSDSSSCTASGAWSGEQAANGTSVQTPAAAGSLTFTLTCSGASTGSSAKSTTLNVTAPTAFTVTNLVADTAGTAALSVDAHLVNPWGIAVGPTTAFWVANNRAAAATQYDGNGKAQPTTTPLVVNLAPSAAGAPFNPTGIVFNASSDFVVSATASGAAHFIFAGEGGMIAGWSPVVDRTHAITAFTATDGAVYKGLAIANNGGSNFLYATDFHGNKVDVFDTHFTKQTTSAAVFAFVDPTLPAGYAPFGIQALNTGAAGATQIYVTYAQQNGTDNRTQTNGAGLGLVDIFDTNGGFVARLVSTGAQLNAPWGVALAPADFGTLSNAVLVGNFGDGKINAFATGTGAFVGAVADAQGTAFALPGLWGIAFGNDTANQPHNALFFAAGVNDQTNGEFGRIDAGGAPTLNASPVVTLTGPTGTVSGTVNVSATVQSNVAIAKVEFFAGGVALGAVTLAPYTTVWDTTTIANGTVAINAKATDVDGNVGIGAGDVVVSNGPAPATLSQLQATVFTPICSGCHNGSNPPGGALPGSQNLTAGNTFAALVGVASLEQPTLQRVKAGDPDNSYLIRKLEGSAGISGSRMPLGGPFLDQATIDQVRSWISNGAPNN